jgi:hypothetical protein
MRSGLTSSYSASQFQIQTRFQIQHDITMLITTETILLYSKEKLVSSSKLQKEPLGSIASFRGLLEGQDVRFSAKMLVGNTALPWQEQNHGIPWANGTASGQII